MRKDINGIQRYTREFNIRVWGIEEEKRENCRAKLVSFIEEHDLLPGKSTQQIDDSIEYAHRIGENKAGQTRAIIARLHSREIRNKVINNGKRKGKDSRNLVQEDWIKEDYEQRKKALPKMKAAFESGKKSRFFRGQLFIDNVVVDL